MAKKIKVGLNETIISVYTMDDPGEGDEFVLTLPEELVHNYYKVLEELEYLEGVLREHIDKSKEKD